MRRLIKGQSVLEYSILMIIIVAVFVAMNVYVKRGIQGRWKSSVDDMGDQYDPRTANSIVNSTLISTSNSSMDIVPGLGGKSTVRTDVSTSIENRTSNTMVAPFNG